MRPNILIFMTDQEQADVVHPDHPCITPNATKLAQEGVLFNRSFCPTAHCCPSRATFMTGVYPSRHGIYNNVSNPTAIHHELYEVSGCSVKPCDLRVITWRMPENGTSRMPRTHLTAAGRICTSQRAKAATCTVQWRNGKNKPNNPNRQNANADKFSVPVGDTINCTNPTRPTRRKATKTIEIIVLSNLGWRRYSDCPKRTRRGAYTSDRADPTIRSSYQSVCPDV